MDLDPWNYRHGLSMLTILHVVTFTVVDQALGWSWVFSPCGMS